MLMKAETGKAENGAGGRAGIKAEVAAGRKRPLTLRRFVIRWHRRLGLVSALLVLVLALTGLILNRTVDWQLDERLVKAAWVAGWYGLDAKTEPAGFRAGGHWVAVLEDHIYIDGRYAGLKDGAIIGAVLWDGGIVTGGEAGLMAWSAEGQLFDQIGPDALPGTVTGIGRMADGGIAVSTDRGVFAAHNDLRQWNSNNDNPAWSESEPRALPRDMSGCDRPFQWTRIAREPSSSGSAFRTVFRALGRLCHGCGGTVTDAADVQRAVQLVGAALGPRRKPLLLHGRSRLSDP